ASFLHIEPVLSALIGFLCLVLSMFWLNGCAVGPDYRRPPLEVPATFRGEQSGVSSNAFAELPWWDFFKDPALKDLIAISLTNNYDARIAVARIEQAQAIVAQNRALFFPQLTYGGLVGRSKNATSAGPVPNGGQVNNIYEVQGNVSWEI